MGPDTGINEELHHSKHLPAPSAKVTSTDNVANLELSSHQRAQAATHSTAISPATTTSTTAPSKQKALSTDSSDELSDENGASTSKWIHKGKDSVTKLHPGQTTEHPRLRSQQNVTAQIDEEGPDNLLKEIHVIDIDEPIKVLCESRSRDIDAFFSAPYPKDGKKLLPRKSKKKSVPIVNEVTTLQHHQEALHKPEYLKWAKENNFVSMLPKDAKRHRKEVTADTQLTLDPISGQKKP
ncbi:hypothetical protein SCLCIDRAFT_31646 [Scleroderma citrinum Foug A]|uniref:Uncharacterized protein n=1 Tax=Scleroderma citrinum Foug A TaxID=1036808 RepID=A0A0C3CYZ1_9AGAM|nr:hypothetical protein SCLCIDRAFT_31646 [Scleroderma citrinum Foug A]